MWANLPWVRTCPAFKSPEACSSPGCYSNLRYFSHKVGKIKDFLNELSVPKKIVSSWCRSQCANIAVMALYTVHQLKRKRYLQKVLKHERNSRLSMQPLQYTVCAVSTYIAAVISIVAGRFVANLRCLHIILEIFYFYHELEGISSMVLNKNIRKCCFKVSTF